MVEASVRPGDCAVQLKWIGWTKGNDCLAGFESAIAGLLEILLCLLYRRAYLLFNFHFKKKKNQYYYQK